MLRMRSVPNRNTKNQPLWFTFSKQRRIGHFTLLFCRGRQRNLPRIITHVHNYCSALQTSIVWWRSRSRCRRVLRKIPNHPHDYRPNWTPHSPLPLLIACYTVLTRPNKVETHWKQLSKIAILGFQFGLYHGVIPLSFLRSISLVSLFAIFSGI